ncbi:MAG: S1C family serine protease [Phycisphaerae bacterium]
MTAVAAILLSACLAATKDTGGGVDPYGFERARASVIRSAVAKIAPSIVTIETIGGAQPLAGGGREAAFKLAEGPTTGLVWSSDGLILTSSFNFARKPSIITVTLPDGRRAVATLLGRDEIRRLALLKIEASDLVVPEWVKRDALRVGQYALACGRALGGEVARRTDSETTPTDGLFVSLGIVSALDRRNGNAVQTDAKVSPVSYGGPLIDMEGRVIGLLVPMAGAGGALAGAEWYDSGIGFAIHREKVDFVADRLAAGETIQSGKIGIRLAVDKEESLIPLLDKLLPPTKGVKIGHVAEHSPASRAKLRKGDKILAIDGRPTGDMMELLRLLSDRAAGEEITLTIQRRWRKLDVKLRLVPLSKIGQPASRPEEQDDGG